MRAACDDGVGAVVGALERHAARVAANPDEAGGDEVVWQLVWQLLAGIVPRQRKTGASTVVLDLLIIFSTEVSSFFKNSLGKTFGQPKTDSAGERPLSSLS